MAKEYTPFGAGAGIWSDMRVGNDGLGRPGRELRGGFEEPLERKAFNPEVLQVRSGGGSSVASHHRGEEQRAARQAQDVLRSPHYPAAAPERQPGQHLGKLQFAQGHMPGSQVGHLMAQTPAHSNAGSAQGVQVMGWGPTTRILHAEDGNVTNRSTAALRKHDVPLNPISILYRGGLYGADRGLRVGYHDAENVTGHQAAPYIHPPAHARPDGVEGGGGGGGGERGGDGDEGGENRRVRIQDEQRFQEQSRGQFPRRDIGHMEADVRKTPAGLGGAPRNPSPLGAPLHDIKVPDAPPSMSVEGVRLLNAIQHAVGPFYHHLGERYNKKDFERVLRLSGLHHRVTQFENVLGEVWEMVLDTRGVGYVEWQHGVEVLKLKEMDKKWEINKFPYDRDDKLPSYYGNKPELADPKWRQKIARRRHDEERIEEQWHAREPAQGNAVYHRNKQREAKQDALIDARASFDSRHHVPGVRAKRDWRLRNDENVHNDVFSSASKAASRRNSSLRASAPSDSSSADVRAPPPGPGEIWGPNFYAERTPQYRQTLQEAAERQRWERQQLRDGLGGPQDIPITGREERGRFGGGGAMSVEPPATGHQGVPLGSGFSGPRYRSSYSSNPVRQSMPEGPAKPFNPPAPASVQVRHHYHDYHEPQHSPCMFQSSSPYSLRDPYSQKKHSEKDHERHFVDNRSGPHAAAARSILQSHLQ